MSAPIKQYNAQIVSPDLYGPDDRPTWYFVISWDIINRRWGIHHTGPQTYIQAMHFTKLLDGHYYSHPRIVRISGERPVGEE